MVVAGVGWGLYSLAGKASGGESSGGEAAGPAVTTARAFARAAVVVVPLTALAATRLSATAFGLLLATVMIPWGSTSPFTTGSAVAR